jgi:hypothetical protein
LTADVQPGVTYNFTVSTIDLFDPGGYAEWKEQSGVVQYRRNDVFSILIVGLAVFARLDYSILCLPPSVEGKFTKPSPEVILTKLADAILPEAFGHIGD